MGYLKIKCMECGGSWEVCHYNFNDDHLRMCPHCCKEIDRQTWQNYILPAYGALEDANRELVKDHTGYPGVALFKVDYHHKNHRRAGGSTAWNTLSSKMF